ncbi:MAG: DUF882 domain-containing protein [Deltaproteobacteria bacterium]|nr:DUF882 domain-containing protein [Deltaproteobacteria bacterium]
MAQRGCALAVVLCGLLEGASVSGQGRPGGSTAPAPRRPPAAPAPVPTPRRVPGLAVAVAQGASDEVLLPVTVVRVPRAPRGSRARPAARAPRAPAPCLHRPVEVLRYRGGRREPAWVGPLTDCQGRPTVQALAALSLLAQPGHDEELTLPAAVRALRRALPTTGWDLYDEARPPTAPTAPPRRERGARGTRAPVAPPAPPTPRDPRTHDPVVTLGEGVRTLHPRLLRMLQQVVDHFPGHTVELISGYRPYSRDGSRHAHARALDFRLAGVSRELLRDFARTLPDAGVGYYPNSVFVHLDVRDGDEGRAFWVDYSGPGETARYGRWPPTGRDVQREVDHILHRVDDELATARRREDGPRGDADPER